jgi:hypothetical protein
VRWTGHFARIEALVEQNEGKRPLGRGWLLWACNIKRSRKKKDGNALIGFVCLRSRDTWRASVNMIMNIRFRKLLLISLRAEVLLASRAESGPWFW